jgi:cellulose synthase/poly-beta-1,6-N-acetylglucosamine synthase-like glycosyltransferase
MNIALMAFNVLRPRGRDRLGLSAGILGNGFALSRKTLERVPYHAVSVVEDLEYHIRLVNAGLKVRFVDTATVYGEMPTGGKGVSTQRARWEGGRFRMAAKFVPPLLGDVCRGKLRLLEPLGDLLLLPLAFHVALVLLSLMTPLWPIRLYAVCALGVVAVHVLATIAVCGGNWRDLGALFSAVFYVLWKVRTIPALLRNASGNAVWVRTERPRLNGVPK